MTGTAGDRRARSVNRARGSIWTDGGTWVCLFLAGSALLAWGILSLPFDGVVRGVILFFAIIAAAVACGLGWLETMSNTPLPPLDRTPRTARVREIREWDQPDTIAEVETKRIVVAYDGADGSTHTAWLGDLIHASSITGFTPGSRWQVYAFADPDLADTMVVLTEAHDEVRRSGSLVTGLHGNREFLTLRQPTSGSPFLNDTHRFAS
ncbi:hypothetical protein [Streptomyces sp. NPDC058045]|uniref:hypothetical protein n=1 Tax=Streptomyces sp. NPDC058045 TaxID=3346311 RepID=UPI0036E71DE6